MYVPPAAGNSKYWRSPGAHKINETKRALLTQLDALEDGHGYSTAQLHKPLKQGWKIGALNGCLRHMAERQIPFVQSQEALTVNGGRVLLWLITPRGREWMKWARGEPVGVTPIQWTHRSTIAPVAKPAPRATTPEPLQAYGKKKPSTGEIPFEPYGKNGKPA